VCRCTGYKKIIEGISLAGAILRGEASVDPALEEGEESAVAAAQERTRSILNRLPLRELTTEGFGREEAMLELFHRPEWDQLSESCLGCGACTFACPTCQCYDIKDYDTGHGVKRYRCWDSCMYSDFTMMAHGNNRTSQLQRFRQRFMHKLVYFPANNNGMYSCVGCGRCVEKCPSSLNIVKVIKAFEKHGGEK
jgi:sulfhydrogenase subunit beta (sulfur reductase)